MVKIHRKSTIFSTKMTITQKIKIEKIWNMVLHLFKQIPHLSCKFEQFWKKKICPWKYPDVKMYFLSWCGLLPTLRVFFFLLLLFIENWPFSKYGRCFFFLRVPPELRPWNPHALGLGTLASLVSVNSIFRNNLFSVFFFKSGQTYMKDAECAESKEEYNFRFFRFLFFELWSL